MVRSSTKLRHLRWVIQWNTPWRRALSGRSVRRDIQGVELWMPWSHRLPDYAATWPDYGQNLVKLAALLGPLGSAEPLQVLDVGANIGDSTKQILNQAQARVLAVEADPYYLGFLERNVGDLPEVTIAPVLLTTASKTDLTWVPTRRGGTTHFSESAAEGSAPDDSQQATTATPPASVGSVSVAQLPEAFPDFGHIRLIKSDTDGHDTELIPELAAAYRSAKPVLFFEFDPGLTLAVAALNADDIWGELAELGYDRVGLWSHVGVPVGICPIDGAAEAAAKLIAHSKPRVPYLDIVAVHADDPAGQAAIDTLFDTHTLIGE